MKRLEKLFFNFSMDCETAPPQLRSPCGGPESWESSERAILGITEVMETKGVLTGLTLMPTTEAVVKHASILRGLHDTKGIELGLQLEVRNFDGYALNKGLGEYDREELVEILTRAKKVWEDAVGLPCETFRACCASFNDHIFPILEELGFKQTSCAAPYRYFPEDPHLSWWGAYRYPHHTNRKSRLRVGEMKLYEIPVTRDHWRWIWGGRAPFDLRADWRPGPSPFDPKVPWDPKGYIPTIYDNIEDQLKCEQPIIAIIGATHNTQVMTDLNHYARKNLEFIIDYTRRAAEKFGLEFTPSSFENIRKEAERIDAF